jgi:hypothetical protein
VWSGSGKHGSPGSLKATNVLGVFGPSSFGYSMFTLVYICQCIQGSYKAKVMNIM